MLAVGVAFHIYYIIAWRAGIADLLASSLTRAIFFSALVLLSHEAEHLEAGPSRRKRPVSSMRPGDVLRRE